MKNPSSGRPGPYSVILASGSPRRRELLEILGLPFTVVLPGNGNNYTETDSGGGIDETSLPGESPADLVQRLSRAKAQAVAARLPLRISPDSTPAANRSEEHQVIIIAADTIVVLGGKILGKPISPSQATQMLKALRQQRYHYVYSGLNVGLWRPGGVLEQGAGSGTRYRQTDDLHLLTRLHQSQVWMRPYTDSEIEAYVASGDPLDKAGAYGIQNKSFAPVEHLDGCFTSVMGLPLGELATALGEIGLSLPEISSLCTRYTGHPCCQQPNSL